MFWTRHISSSFYKLFNVGHFTCSYKICCISTVRNKSLSMFNLFRSDLLFVIFSCFWIKVSSPVFKKYIETSQHTCSTQLKSPVHIFCRINSPVLFFWTITCVYRSYWTHDVNDPNKYGSTLWCMEPISILPKKTLFTHMTALLDQKDLLSKCPENVEPAYDGLEITLWAIPM